MSSPRVPISDRRLAGLLLVAMLICPSPARAQTGNQGAIEGLARDPSGAVVPGAQVSVLERDSGLSYTTLTNGTGSFGFPALPVGTYQVRAECRGFAALVFDNVELRVGARITLLLWFQPEAQSVAVTVTGQVPLIETARSQVSATVDSRSITTLPVNGRDFTSFALLLPAVTTDARGGLSFGGQRAMNSLLVDGMSANDDYWGQPIGEEGFPVTAGQSGYHLSLDAVQEFQVNSNAYSAELGRAGGGVVNAITKSGAGGFRGTAYEFYRDRSLNANDIVNERFGLPKDPLHFHQFGGVLGGPIVQPRLSFMLSYDSVRSSVANAVSLNLPPGFRLSSDAPTAASQQRALDYLRPRAHSWSFPFRQDDWLTKLDWQATPRHAIAVRWVRQRVEAAFSGLPQQSRENALPVSASLDIASGSLTSTIAASLVNVARFGYTTTASRFLPVATTPMAQIFEQGLVLTIGESRGAPQHFLGSRVQWSDTVSWLSGRHAFKAGIDVLLGDVTYFTAQNFAGRYLFLSLASFGDSLAGTPRPRPGESLLQVFSGLGTPGVTTHPDTKSYAAFFQDEWRVAPTLTLNVGLRYDLQILARPPVKNPSATLLRAGLDTSFRPIDTRDVAPRLGLAWAPGAGNKIVVRAGYGVFYAPTISAMAARAHFFNGISAQPRIFTAGVAGAYPIPAYPSSICGPPDPTGVPPSCGPPMTGAADPLLMLFSPTYRQPYTQQASVGFEVALRQDLSFSVGYELVQGARLPWVRDINLAATTTATTIGIAGTNTRFTYQRYPDSRPLTGFDRVSVFDSGGSSAFHGLAITVNRRFSRSYQFLLSYTLSKTVDDNPDVYAINPGGSDSQLLSDPLHPSVDRSLSVNDRRHRLVLSGLWQPHGADALPSLAKVLLDGWSLAEILTAQSGSPYSGMVSFDLNNDGNTQTDRTPGVGRNTFVLPALVSLDLRLARTLRLGGHRSAEIMGEAFNALNRANVTAVNDTQYTVANSPAVCGVAGVPCLVPRNARNAGLTAFGTPTATAGARVVQLGVRLSF